MRPFRLRSCPPSREPGRAGAQTAGGTVRHPGGGGTTRTRARTKKTRRGPRPNVEAFARVAGRSDSALEEDAAARGGIGREGRDAPLARWRRRRIPAARSGGARGGDDGGGGARRHGSVRARARRPKRRQTGEDPYLPGSDDQSVEPGRVAPFYLLPRDRPLRRARRARSQVRPRPMVAGPLARRRARASPGCRRGASHMVLESRKRSNAADATSTFGAATRTRTRPRRTPTWFRTRRGGDQSVRGRGRGGDLAASRSRRLSGPLAKVPRGGGDVTRGFREKRLGRGGGALKRPNEATPSSPCRRMTRHRCYSYDAAWFSFYARRLETRRRRQRGRSAPISLLAERAGRAAVATIFSAHRRAAGTISVFATADGATLRCVAFEKQPPSLAFQRPSLAFRPASLAANADEAPCFAGR